MKIEIVFEDGRKETFENVASVTKIEKQAVNQTSAREVAKSPTEGKLFEINPFGMDRSLFEKKRGNERQELTRQIINDAFAEVDKQPEKYVESFYTLIPEKTWGICEYKTIDELQQYAKDLGGQMADWIQQALEWAQRICNGESWESVSNNADTANWYRMIIWGNGFYRLVGGMRVGASNFPASYVRAYDYDSENKICNTVPLVVLKKQH